MMKGIMSMIGGAFVVALLLAGIAYLFFSGFLLALFGFLLGGLVIAAVLFFVIVFLFAVVVFFALLYFLAEKKPEVTPGEYDLTQEQGKHEDS